MNIPRTVPFDKRVIERLWARVGNFKLSRDAEAREAIVAALSEYRVAVGLPRRDSYAGITEMYADLNTFLRIAKMKEKGINQGDRVVIGGTPGIAIGMIGNGHLTIELEHGSAKTRNVEPKLADKAA